jgi:hypothetical protein
MECEKEENCKKEKKKNEERRRKRQYAPCTITLVSSPDNYISPTRKHISNF